ncbi:MAG: WXG100 family type VII secretion target [Clostridium sp.]|nr:WXG100 family type VII secretion target [Clostridium sp.]
MAVEGIKIDINWVADIAGVMGKIRQELAEALDTINQEIASTKTIWESDSEKVLQAQYSEMMNKTADFYHDLGKYQEFLIQTAREYGYIEKQINSNADSFQ